MESNYTYKDAFSELQQIVSEIETGDVNVDELADKIKKASQLILICKAKLTSSEEEVNALLAKLQETDQGTPDSD
ncbi:exodeoxyribonuclease VII small subunit [Sphingobacterium yanglingense]|uniref:Exodeoxyribonuclease 7 small subunit n=1 Tax=Sphingobacterium yanglingense TaxID=1437280 RepID=A0A4R6WFI1_9SPHI|nr:exodeoxyribonuclease VII small subunit [Sphingobacterium yanglingense]TDQ75972.1 exodeoxyribonuclease VII small subunit [Sphingobacterium yanglingense]